MRHLILPLLAASALVAAEGNDSSIRLSLTAMPNDADVEVTLSGSGGGSFSDTASGEWNDGAGRLAIMAFNNQGSPVAFNIGAGVASTGFKFSKNGVDQKLGELGIIVEPGIALNVNEHFALELGIPLGIGAAKYEQTDSNADYEAEGHYVEIGAVARPVLKLDHLQLFAELGWISNQARFKEDDVAGLPDTKAEFEITTEGTYYSLGIGLSF